MFVAEGRPAACCTRLGCEERKRVWESDGLRGGSFGQSAGAVSVTIGETGRKKAPLPYER